MQYNVEVGDLIKFWDYTHGHGYVEGLVVSVAGHEYSSDIGKVPSLHVLYLNDMQVIPLDDEGYKITLMSKAT